AGQRLDAEVAVLAATMQERRAYLLLQDEHGTFFQDWTSFCAALSPLGLVWTPQLVDVLAKEALDPARRARLVMDAPLLLKSVGGQRAHAPTRAAGGAPLQRHTR